MAGGFDIGGFGSGVGGIATGVGELFAGGGYSQAAGLEQQNAALTKRVTGIQEQQKDREAYMAIGATQADIGAAGFSLAGTGMDLLKDSARQASLDKNMTAVQGQIEENAYLAKAAEYSGMASASTSSGIGSIIGGVAMAALAFSDARVKENIRTIGYDGRGRRWVSFRYRWDAEDVTRRGVLAHEIGVTDPEALHADLSTGMLKVDYTKLRGAHA